MRSLILASILFSSVSFADSAIVKFKAVPSGIEFKKGWSKLLPGNTGRFKNVYKFKDPKKAFSELKTEISKRYKTEYIESQTVISPMSIVPSRRGNWPVDDPLLSYQWGTLSNGQKVFNEITDIRDVLIPGSPKFDIGLDSLKNIDNLFIKKEVIVAVLDTGVDFNHPDLKANIALKEDECENGEIPFDPPAVDGDLYPGDCKGWSFTGSKEEGNNRPEDFVGHGTHISGIISAVKNNGVGITGISNKIKILPVKILSDQSEANQAIGTSERLVKGIEYAISRKVDVINLSLGWPLSFDKGHLKEIVMEAIDKGIIVVAASGNNDHSEPIMPCGYEGVVCVGSSDPNGKFSDFSNFGAHVDLLAPGNNILSTNPSANTPLFFDFNGYEIKSGTSQAAPYVSALAATLIGLYPEESSDEIKSRMFTNTDSVLEKTKFATGGLINFEKSINSKGSMIRPRFKGFNRVKVNANDLSFKFEVEFENFLKSNSSTLVTIQPLDSVQISNSTQQIQDNKVNFEGKYNSLDDKLLQKFKLVVSDGQSVKEYKFEKRFYLDFADLAKARSFEITGGLPKTLNKLSTINYYHHPYTKPYYYTFTKSRNGKLFVLFSKDGNEIKKQGITILKDASDLLSVHMIDANLDGKQDVVIRYMTTVEKEGEDPENAIVYAYLDMKLKPLFSETIETEEGKRVKSFSEFTLKFESTILTNLSNFSWTKMTYDKYGEILVPVYLNFVNNLPEADRNPNPFARLRNRSFSSRIYYYSPKLTDEKPEFVTRTMNTNKFTDALKRKIGFRPFQQVFLVKFKTQSFEDIKNGKFDLYLSLESERKLPKNFFLTVNNIESNDWKVTALRGNQINFSSMNFDNGINLSSSMSVRHDYDLEVVATEKRSKLLFDELSFDGNNMSPVSIEQDDIYNPLELPIKRYRKGEQLFRFFLTPSKIFLSLTEGRDETQLTYPTHVSSFLPGALFREQHFPIVLKGKDGNLPALYVDSTQIASRNIYLISYLDGKLVSPLRFNINIPEMCKALNPIVSDQGIFEYSLLCFEDQGKARLIYIPLELD